MRFNFVGFNVRGCRGLVAIHETFVWESLDINGCT